MGLLPDGLLELIRCPACHGELEEREDPPRLLCRSCAVVYPVRDGIPVMLEEESRPAAD